MTVSVVTTTDLHGHVEAAPFTLKDSAGVAQKAERGGLPLIAGYVNNLRARRPVVLVDAGDLFQGTLTSNLSEGQAVVDAYQQQNPAVSVKISAEQGAGGFILPNDRVDVILTRKLGNDDQGVPSFRAMTVLRSIRVLAVDQTAKEEGDSNAIVGKTATLELDPRQAEIVSLAEAMGDLHLSLRSLSTPDQPDAAASGDGKANHAFGGDDDSNQIAVFRWGAPSRAATAGSANE